MFLPWLHEDFADWSIAAMHHCGKDKRRISVLMTHPDGRYIFEEGYDSESIWDNLRHAAAAVFLTPEIAVLPIDKLEITERSRGALLNDNILTIGDLVSKSQNQLLRIPNFGKISLKDVIGALRYFNLHLKGSSW